MCLSVLNLIIIVCEFCPPLFLENHGFSGIFRVLNGFIRIWQSSIILTGSITFRIILDMIPTQLSYQAWGLVREYCSSNDDNKRKIITTATILGKHDCFKMLVLFYIFSDLYVCIDMLSISISNGLPLILIPWQLRQLYNIKTMKLKYLVHEVFFYMMVVNFLFVLGVMHIY